ncbi:hypothetical protein SAMN05216257_10280 [Meinhardsimonia xiamenensis]|jgi:uncharacterized membrane protein YfcA|uniref:Probable membrane transporter protein n=1 Tax=Meinhardsimonia xiamenensis TaxID=990712 RepID=A0A1G9AE01_9RHOB|nr:sulfite exporter TauE/SafE family protein [Meinhardsimonia xiamenensis]PRX35441.1 hypothetical protein LV81_02039 [Meinhardsimonia xiamenensis]SDK25044.1 hypothetical protein SAMN05216257_10280 [Meinhardsimonia xiamenensis]
MTGFLAELSPGVLAFTLAATVAAGFVKGAVGFAMPMIMISALGSVLRPDLALAALILPTLLSNLWQALRGGLRPALASAWKFREFVAIVLVFILVSAQLVRVLPQQVMYLLLGLMVTAFALAQLMGWRPVIRPEHRRRAEIVLGTIAGFVGGISGVWGPPTVLYLNAIEAPKLEHIRVQGVVYALGSVALLGGHLNSGVLNATTLPASAALCLPALLGMALGFRLSDRLDQERFRRATLVVLTLAGLNLLRRGFLG